MADDSKLSATHIKCSLSCCQVASGLSKWNALIVSARRREASIAAFLSLGFSEMDTVRAPLPVSRRRVVGLSGRAIFDTRLVTGGVLEAMVIAVGSRIHRMNPYAVVFLDVLPRRPAQAQAHYLVVGLHPRGDRSQCPTDDGAGHGDALYQGLQPGLTALASVALTPARASTPKYVEPCAPRLPRKCPGEVPPG